MTSSSLQQQIDVCRELLQAFQDERTRFSGDDPFSLDEINQGMKNKLQLMQVLGSQTTEDDAGTDAEGPPADPDEDQIRELGMLLEQLLMIERENETLLRAALEGTQEPRPPAPRQPWQKRPALQHPPLSCRQPTPPEPRRSAQPGPPPKPSKYI